ncbi:sugar phosphate isomerase/epimerase family protein [Ferroacidibacillus organovorans]|uniref:sugar phosphate isomerase/epimerase family protein n=1 Tax=Ferroacidibacillus organovorans TaxID=1765683 RepID=UPI001FD09F9E|nr:sugar phosphate isomerase/epimerase family protein [Ferroacidibacillus organovorans]
MNQRDPARLSIFLEKGFDHVSVDMGTLIPPHLKKLGLETVADFASSLGLTAIDLPEMTEEAAQICERHHLRIGTVNVSNVGQLLTSDESRRAEAVEAVCAEIRRAAALGARVVFMCLVPEDRTQTVRDSLNAFEQSFPAVAATCEEVGVQVAFEGWPGPAPHYPTLGYTPEVWRAMFSAVPSPALGLCFDPSHLVRLGIDYMRVLHEFGGRIHHCHGKDTELLAESRYLYGHGAARLEGTPDFSEGPWRYCIPGAGEVDWRRVAFALSALQYSGCVSIELEDARYWGTVEKEREGIRKAYAHLARHFA